MYLCHAVKCLMIFQLIFILILILRLNILWYVKLRCDYKNFLFCMVQSGICKKLSILDGCNLYPNGQHQNSSNPISMSCRSVRKKSQNRKRQANEENKKVSQSSCIITTSTRHLLGQAACIILTD